MTHRSHDPFAGSRRRERASERERRSSDTGTADADAAATPSSDDVELEPLHDDSVLDLVELDALVGTMVDGTGVPLGEGIEAVADGTEVELVNDWSTLTVEQLRDELRARDLQVSGTKAELVARLEAAG